MAAKAPAVSVEQSENGDYTIGATIDGVFVPFAHKHAGYVANVIRKGTEAGKSSSSSAEEE